jgi:tetratricopeptide (TPR) repeat protein
MASPLHGFSGSPVLVEGKVVGHIKRVLSDPDYPGRPALGIVYAVPSRAVLGLLGAAPAVERVEPPEVTSIAGQIPPLPAGQYHAFVSYRSSDRPFALALVNRLEGVGFRIYIDQRELLPGDALANSLQQGLAKSHAGIVLISRGWLESPWCQQEANTLLKRSTEEPGFRVVPVRLDNSPLPPFWDATLYLDFTGKPAPEGDNLNRLTWALVGRTPPANSPETRIVRAEQGSADKLVRLQAAAGVNAYQVYRLWKTWQSAGVAPGSPSLAVAQTLLSFPRGDWALEVLGAAGDGIRAKQLRALALRTLGRRDEALQILRELYEIGQVDPETAGLLAAIYKRDWLDNHRDAALIAAYNLCRTAFDQSGDTYVGINAAALALWRARKEESRRTAQQVLDKLDRVPEADFDPWQLATKAEALLLLGNINAARDWYEKAVAKIPNRYRDIASMRKQARIDLAQLGLKRDAVDSSLPVPCIAAFTGHMTDTPERATPRFPAAKEGKVRLAIREKLKAHGTGIGLSSAARGGDLLFVEELIAIGGEANVYLPFGRDAFLRTSVGPEWKQRYDRILSHDRVKVTELSPGEPKPAEEQDAYSACNDRIRADAINLGRELDEQPVLITVWDGRPGDRGGAGEAIQGWRDEGYEPENIDPTAV